MPRKKKTEEGEWERSRREEKERRAAVFAALWVDPKYIALDAKKDAALKRWNQLDAYKNASGPIKTDPHELHLANQAVTRAQRVCQDYENEALIKAGCTPDTGTYR